MNQQIAGAPIDWRADLGVGEVELRRLYCRLVGLDGRPIGLGRRVGLVVLLRGADSFIQ